MKKKNSFSVRFIKYGPLGHTSAHIWRNTQLHRHLPHAQVIYVDSHLAERMNQKYQGTFILNDVLNVFYKV